MIGDYVENIKWLIGTFVAFIIGGIISFIKMLVEVKQLKEDKKIIHERITSVKDEIKEIEKDLHDFKTSQAKQTVLLKMIAKELGVDINGID